MLIATASPSVPFFSATAFPSPQLLPPPHTPPITRCLLLQPWAIWRILLLRTGRKSLFLLLCTTRRILFLLLQTGQSATASRRRSQTLVGDDWSRKVSRRMYKYRENIVYVFFSYLRPFVPADNALPPLVLPLPIARPPIHHRCHPSSLVRTER